MEDRQQQLVAAAEAMRTWIYAQRAIWAEGYPQSLNRAQPQFAGAGVAAALALPAAVVSELETAPAEMWPADAGRSWSEGMAERLGSTVQGTTTFVRTSWRMLAAIAAVVIVVAGVRFAWPSMRSKVSSNLASGRDAVRGRTPPSSSQRANGDRAAAATGNAGVAAKVSGRLQVESSPTGAHVLIDGRDRGVTPLTVDGLAIGSHKVVIRGNDGSVQQTVSITSADTVQLSESIYSGWLHVSAPFEVQISEGRKSITLDDSNQVLLAPGPHDVRFENRALGLREVRHLDIRPGETTALSIATPVSHVTVTASEPATVAIDGKEVGETPLTEFAVPVGTRDVTVTSASGVVRHQTMTVKVESAHIDVDFSKP
jgi:hypothetical protein